MSATILWNGDKLVVDADGRTRALTTDQFFALSPDVDLHETAALAIASKGLPVHILGRARDLRPRHARNYGVSL